MHETVSIMLVTQKGINGSYYTKNSLYTVVYMLPQFPAHLSWLFLSILKLGRC